MTIVTSTYRYKRPPRKRAKAAAIEVPAIVTAASKRSKVSMRVDTSDEAKAAPATPSNDDRKSAIVTAKNPQRGRSGDVPDMPPEEHKRRGDAADALFREMKRQIAEKLREGE